MRVVCKDLSLSSFVFRCRAMTELLRSPSFSSAASLAGGSAVRALPVCYFLGVLVAGPVYIRVYVCVCVCMYRYTRTERERERDAHTHK